MGFEHKNSRGEKYYLHSKEMKNKRVLFFFSKKSDDSVELPQGYKIIENPKTGLPMLKKTG